MLVELATGFLSLQSPPSNSAHFKIRSNFELCCIKNFEKFYVLRIAMGNVGVGASEPTGAHRRNSRVKRTANLDEDETPLFENMKGEQIAKALQQHPEYEL